MSAGCHSDDVPKKSISRVRQPIHDMLKTQTYTDIYEDVEQESTLILNCYGIPGSGKSQIIRKLATQFPYQESKPNLYIKWHIQCKDSGHNVKEELKKLAEQLNEVSSTDNCIKTVTDQLEEDLAEALIDELKKCNVPVLIVIEDPPEDSKRLINDFCRYLIRKSKSETKRSLEDSNSKTATDDQKPCFHVYITSRKKFSVLSENEFHGINCFKMQYVQGFRKEEAISYLLKKKNEVEETKETNEKEQDVKNKEAAFKVFNRFSGLPLGLQAAKGYCESAKIDYEYYLQMIRETEYEIFGKEKDEIVKKYEKEFQHVFEAIVMIFEEDTKKKKSLDVLCCLSYLHYKLIPSDVIEICCYELSKSPSYMLANADKGQLITKLMEHGMCTETPKMEVTIHEVVLNAFRLSHNPASDEQSKSLRKCVEILSCIVSKDIRNKENFERMCQLRPHLQSLLDNVEKEEDFFEGGDSILLKSLVSRLYETAAVVMLAESPSFRSTSGEYFQKALQHICGENEVKSLVETKNKQCKEIAKEVVEESLYKAKQRPSTFIQDYISKVKMYFDEKELKSKRKKNANIREKHQSLVKSYDNEQIKELRDRAVSMPNTTHKDIFYCEKVASILHSWSRVILYADAKTESDIEKCMWLSSLSHQISVECRTQCKIALLSEKLVTKSGQIPLLLKQKENTENLQTAKKLCEDGLKQISHEHPFYEDGLLKEVDLFSHISFLRDLVRINCRLLATGKEVDRAEADEKCKELLNLARKHLENMSNGLMCIIYCAKYYAVTKDFNEATKCFNIYFQKSQEPRRFNVHAWAIYNYAKMVKIMVNNERLLKKDALTNRIEDALTKCKEVLESSNVIGADLRKRLQETVDFFENQ